MKTLASDYIRGVLVSALVLAILLPAARAITYADWIASYGITGDAAAPAYAGADGIPNLLKYALDGYDPTVSSGTVNVSYPQLGICLRVGDALDSYGLFNGNGVSRIITIPSDGSVYHYCLKLKPRVGVTGIRYVVSVGCNSEGLFSWYSGRNAIFDQALTGGYWQAVAKMPGNKGRWFMRLSIVQDATVTNPFADCLNWPIP